MPMTQRDFVLCWNVGHIVMPKYLALQACNKI